MLKILIKCRNYNSIIGNDKFTRLFNFWIYKILILVGCSITFEYVFFTFNSAHYIN